MNSAFGIVLAPGEHRPGDADHAVEGGGEAVRLGQRLQSRVQLVEQRRNDDFRPQRAEMVQRRSGVGTTEFREDG